VNLTLGGGSNREKIAVWIQIDTQSKKLVHLLSKKKDCWADFGSKVSGELGHDGWSAEFDGELWIDDTKRPEDFGSPEWSKTLPGFDPVHSARAIPQIFLERSGLASGIHSAPKFHLPSPSPTEDMNKTPL
jgi:hypothetical protein